MTKDKIMSYEIVIKTTDNLNIRSFDDQCTDLSKHVEYALKCEGGRKIEHILKITVTELNHALKWEDKNDK